MTNPSTDASLQAADDRHDRHFRTDHLMADLKGRSVRGGAVTLTAQGVKFVLQMGSTMVLARLLTPSDFGLVAMVTAVTGFVAMFKDAGLSMATVQREQITHAQVSTLFWINVALSLVVMLVIAALAPPIAWFYGEPRLVWITLALSATFIFGGLTVQHQALLRRQMRFTALAATEIGSMAAGIATAIIMAWRGFGYWALVGLTAGSTVINCALVWVFCRWRPGRPVRQNGITSMLQFGGGLTTFNLLDYITRNIDNIIVGAMLGTVPLGLYSKAYGLLMMPIQQINVPVGSVMVPSLSRLQNDPEHYRRALLRCTGMLAFAGMPVVALLFVCADDVVTIVLGSGWEAAVPIFRWLAPAGLLYTVNVAPGWLCLSRGRIRVLVIYAALSAFVMTVFFLVGARWGAVGVAAGFSFGRSLLFVVFIVLACHRSPVSLFDILSTISTPLVTSITASVTCFALISFILDSQYPSLIRICLATISFGIVYFGLNAALPTGRRQFSSLWSAGLSLVRRPS